MLATTSQPTQGGTGQTTASPATVAGAGGIVPFTRASMLHIDPQALDTGAVAIGTGSGTLPLLQVPAYGFLRSLLIKVTITPTGGTPVFAADGPFNALTDAVLSEPNGAPIVQFNSNGYGLYQANKLGGYRNQNEPKQWAGYSAASGAAVFFVRIPLELNFREALGSLANQNAAAMYQLRLGINTLGNIYSSLPTSATIRVQVWPEEWDQPPAAGSEGTNETAPPALNTTQNLTHQLYSFAAGQQSIRLTRVGNYIRNLILVFRNASGVRDDTVVPQQTTIALDSQPVVYLDQSVWKQQMSERWRYFGTQDTAGALDTGVYQWGELADFSGSPGFETRNQWLETGPASRLEIQGNFPAAGTLQVITNDVVLAANVFLGN